MDLQLKDLGYSLKNIPIPSKQAYMKSMIEKLEVFIKRVRWKAFFFLNEEEGKKSFNNFGFKTENTPPPCDYLKDFENDLYELVKNIEFKSNFHQTKFQARLSKDIKEIRNSDLLLISADKTSNLYGVHKQDYLKLLNDNITAKYKKAHKSIQYSINKEAKEIASNLKLEDRVEVMAERKAFITLKDHKDDFMNNPKCRLINPAKSEIGKISKRILEKTNAEVNKCLHLNQWRSTDSVINWFKNIENKKECKFLKFDIVDFYPSISENLLQRSLTFARSFTEITEGQLNIIMHARKSVLFDRNNAWVKKSNEKFDVAMGSFDGAEVCELVGLFLLNEISSIIDKSTVGLYRDDGLAVVRNRSGPQIERLRKDISKLFSKYGLKITLETCHRQANFLDITLSLNDGSYCPYRKPNSQLLYINSQSNHPPSIIRAATQYDRVSTLEFVFCRGWL